jgi:copper transport protein
MILIAVSVAIIASSTGLLFLQITELSSNNISGYAAIFTSLLHGPSGLAWLVRSITSIVVLVCAITYYYLKKNTISGIDDYGQTNLPTKKKILFSSSSLLYLVLVAGSISIFANSATSHNAAVTFIPSLAVSLDWLHFMAVSMWVGGLFYISTILLVAIRHRTIEAVNRYESPGTNMIAVPNSSISSTRKSLTIHYYLALVLPRFSLIATVSLGVIGISGLYMAWIHLNNLGAIFSTTYGNILIIKLAAALPLILLGGYHQLKLHNAVVAVASLGKMGPHNRNYENNNLQVAQSFNNNYTNNNNNNNNNNKDDIVESSKRGTKRKKNEKSDQK